MGLQHTVRLSPAAGARWGQGRAGTALCGGRTMLTLPPGAPEFQGGNPTNSEENAELSITSTESRGLHLPSSDGDPNGCSPTSLSLLSAERKEKGVGWPGATRHAAFLGKPLGKHSRWAPTSFLLGSCLQIRLAQPGCC